MSALRVAGLIAALTVVTAACGAAPSTQTQPSAAGGVDAKTATSATDFGGLDKLVEAAKKEGNLHVIALPPDWANYGEIIKAFETKYGIKVESENPDASSADEITALKTRKGQPNAPDVVDISQSWAFTGAKEGLFAPYKVQAFDKIPEGQKDPGGLWVNDYGGYVSIGCEAKKVGTCPQTFADLLKPEYKGLVALNGNPNKSGSAFGGVWAASLSNGGSLDDIAPGVEFFKKLKAAGNFNPIESTPATVEKGETPISIDWDYLNAGYREQFMPKGLDFQVAVPTDGVYASYYVQAINKDAPHPAAARLWQEFLYSAEGQNLWLKGGARPVLMPSMQADGTIDKALADKLPPVQGEAQFPTEAQTKAAQDALAKSWDAAVAG